MFEHALHWALIHFAHLAQFVHHLPFTNGGDPPPPCGMSTTCD